MGRKIKKIAVLGSGVMGSQIACHFANIGREVLLLDIVPDQLTESEKSEGLSLDDKKVKNRIVKGSLEKAVNSEPAPLYKKEFKNRITIGNFDDDLHKISSVDWILEAVVEKKEVKQNLYEKVEQHRKAGTIVTTNTSGIPIHSLLEGRSDDFKKHFLGTHFFNPPRYLELLEIIPSKSTERGVTEFLQNFGDVYLGKTTIVCKDTPAFIGNRIGVYAIMLTIKLMRDIDLSIEEVDTLTGKFVGRPKTATFRTSDLVGLDVLASVAEGIYENCPEDEEREIFKPPDFLNKMLEKGWKGEKSGQGFYKKVKDEQGKSKILALDIDQMEYKKSDKPKFAILEEVKKQQTTEKKLESFEQGEISTVNFFKKIYLKVFGSNDDKAIRFFREFYYNLFAYCSHRIPEIADEIYKIDKAIRAGFNWDYGPFEIWDILGFEETYKHMEKAGNIPADWVHSMKMKGVTSFYKVEDGHREYWDPQAADYKLVPGTKELIFLDNYRKNAVWSNSGCNIIDIGDGVLNVEFTSKSNSIGLDVIKGINKAIDLAESEDNDFSGIVIGNEGDDFSLGANLGMIGLNAFKGKMDVVKDAVFEFQRMVMRLRYCNVPVVSAVHGKSLGGGVEICLHSDGIQAAAETYIGLVETGAGLIPAGGGAKEFAKRASKQFDDGDPKTHHLQNRLMTIAQGEVAKSAHQAFEYGYLDAGRDRITMNKDRLLAEAKERVIELLERGYTPPDRQEIEVLGRNALSFFYTAISNMKYGNYITEYEEKIARKLAYVMCGGDVTGEVAVSEQYLLDLERDAFMELVGNKKTLKRIEHLLKEGKPLRN